MERKKHWGYDGGRGGEGEIVYAGETRQSNFCTTTFSRFREEGLREEARGIYMRAYTHVHRPWKRINSHEWSSDSRFAIRDSLSHSLRLSPPLSYYELSRAPDSLSTVSMKPDENALSISPSLMIINAKRDEISLMEHNISAVLSWCYYLIYPNERHFSQTACSIVPSPRDFYHTAQMPSLPAINEGD